MSLGSNLRSRRDELGLRLVDVAKVLGVSLNTVSRIEDSESSTLKAEMIPLACKAYQLSPYEFMTMILDFESGAGSIPSKIMPVVNSCLPLNIDACYKVAAYADDLSCSGRYTDNRVDTDVDADDEIEVVAADTGDTSQTEGLQLRTTDNVTPPHDFAVTVRGNSMAPLLNDGDVAFVSANAPHIDGRIYALSIDGSTAVKKVIFENDRIITVSLNSGYSDRVISGAELDNTRILGEVIAWRPTNDRTI